MVAAWPYKDKQILSFAIRVIWAVCLLAADTTHWRTLIHHGLVWDYYGRAPLWLAAFWTSLTFLDPIAAILLFIRPRLGVVMTLAIMVADVSVNGWATTIYGSPTWKLGSQVIFLLSVLISSRFAWNSGTRLPHQKNSFRADSTRL